MLIILGKGMNPKDILGELQSITLYYSPELQRTFEDLREVNVCPQEGLQVLVNQ